MRILQVVYCLGRGGAERLAIDISRSLQSKEDIEVALVTFAKTEEFEYHTGGIQYIHCPARIRLSLSGKNKYEVSAFTEFIKRFQPAIINTHRYNTELIARARPENGVRYFSHIHSNYSQYKRFFLPDVINKSRLTELYERHWLSKRYHKLQNKFIAVSKDTYEYTKRELELKQDNIRLIPNAIDLKRFTPAVEKKPSGSIRLINIGNFSAVKAQEFLIEVINILVQRGLNVEHTFLGEEIAGSGKRKIIEQQAGKLNLNDRVRFMGNVPNPEIYLQQSDIYVHSSFSESFGLVIAEAMACGLPVVCTDAGGNRDIVQDGENGFMIYERNPELFADKVEALIKDKQLYARMSQNALQSSKQFGMDDYTDKLLNFYREALAERQ